MTIVEGAAWGGMPRISVRPDLQATFRAPEHLWTLRSRPIAAAGTQGSGGLRAQRPAARSHQEPGTGVFAALAMTNLAQIAARRGTVAQGLETPDWAGWAQFQSESVIQARDPAAAPRLTFLAPSAPPQARAKPAPDRGPQSGFVRGTQIATAQGLRAVETLRIGDTVLTRDNGLQTLRWVGQHRSRCVRLAPGALEPGVPAREFRVGIEHRLLLSRADAAVYFGAHEVFVAARAAGAETETAPVVHLLFDKHEVILADGLWCESFAAEGAAIAALPEAERVALRRASPGIGVDGPGYAPARHTLRAKEARLILPSAPKTAAQDPS